MIHNLKIHATPFADLVSGAKTAEVRNCADHDFQVGDRVELFLVDESGGNATQSIVREITHVQKGYGLPDDLCVLSYRQPQYTLVGYTCLNREGTEPLQWSGMIGFSKTPHTQMTFPLYVK